MRNALLVLLALLALAGVGWALYNHGRTTERTAGAVQREADDASARKLELEGERDSAGRVSNTYNTINEAAAVRERAVEAVRSLPDADAPLTPDRARVLLDADRRLCAIRPGLCPAGPAAAVGDAAPGD